MFLLIYFVIGLLFMGIARKHGGPMKLSHIFAFTLLWPAFLITLVFSSEFWDTEI